MNQDNGGIIGKINTPTTSVASGVWTLQDQFEAQTSSIWPLAFPQTTIANACRFDDGSSDNLTRTPSSASNRDTFTFSFWVKRSNISSNQSIITARSDGSNYFTIRFEPDDLHIFDLTSGSFAYQIKTNQLFRDISAWYHIVIAFDTTQGTAADRIKIYVNGSQVTSFASASYPSQNTDQYINNTVEHQIGKNGSGDFFDGYMAEFVFVDGQQLLPTSFGAFNPVTNIWEPRGYAGTYSTNGFRLDFANSSALGNDVSGNDNDFTANNLTSLDQATDTCSNNFATLNPLTPTINTTHVYSNGNLTAVPTYVSAGGVTIFHTINPLQGKWYYEIKAETSAGSGNAVHTGVVTGTSATNYTSSSTQSGAEFDIYNNNIEKRSEGSSSTISGSSFSSGDIGMVAVDMDNGKIYIGKNGTWLESSNPATSSNPSVSFTVTNDLVFFTSPVTNSGNSNKAKANMNFGNAPFSISSGNSDGNGYGNFEYAVPSGYYSLNTKNLAEFG